MALPSDTVLDIIWLQERATMFRSAIEQCNRRRLPNTFSYFPAGSCGDAALLLAKFLEESSFGQFNYVLGERDERFHAWLERGDLVVDITADQFPDNSRQVIVECHSKWHMSFEREILHVADFEIYDERTRATLRIAYREVLSHLSRRAAQPFGCRATER
ncbi:MAG: hypothetical protein ACSLFL_15385 [Alphaproteobacteria bacterium]